LLRYLDLNKLSNSMAQPLLTGQILYPIEIMLPPLARQHQIAAMLNEQMFSTERARKAIEEELGAINKLPAALLRRAFNGEL